MWQTSPMGPFDAWPTGSGFEHFYWFVGGETNQYAPAIYQDTVPVEPDRTPEEGYHFTEDMTDRAIDWIGQQKALMADKPFFVYFAPGATHAPHHVSTEWSAWQRGTARPSSAAPRSGSCPSPACSPARARDPRPKVYWPRSSSYWCDMAGDGLFTKITNGPGPRVRVCRARRGDDLLAFASRSLVDPAHLEGQHYG